MKLRASFVALALVLASVGALVITPSVAQAASEATTWYPQDGSGVTQVGSTETLSITGTAAGCGGLIPSADIYVTANRDWESLPDGTSYAGMDVTNTQHLPNTYVGWSIIQEPLWYPGGNETRTGGWDIVIDCDEDGVLSSRDQVIGYGADPGVTIYYSGNLTINKQLLKNEDGARWGAVADVAINLAATVLILDVIQTGTSAVTTATSAATIGAEFVSREIGPALVSLSEDGSKWAAGKLEGAGKSTATGAIVDAAGRLGAAARAIYADPPDSNYTTVVEYVPPTDLADETVDDPVLAGVARLSNAYSTAAAWSEALLHALERFDGASIDNARSAMKLQAQAVADNAVGLLDAITEIRDAAASLKSAIDSSGIEATCSTDLANAKAAQARVANQGFSDDEISGFKDQGLTDDDIADLQNQIVNTQFPDQCWGDFLTTLAEDDDIFNYYDGESGLWTEEALLSLKYQALNIVDAINEGVGENQAPIAQDDEITLANDQYVSFYPTQNDRDPDGDQLTFTVATEPTHGTLDCDEYGNCTYTPNSDYIGSDSFTYTVTDPEGLQGQAAVSINVVPSGRATLHDDKVSVAPGGTVTFSVTDNDYLPYGGTISSWTQPQLGSAECDQGGYSCTYAPDEGTLNDYFTYTVTSSEWNDVDGTWNDVESTANVIITVNTSNRPPVVFFQTENPQAQEGSIPSLSFVASDPDGQIVSYHWETSTGLSGDGSWNAPAPEDNGIVTYTLTVTDDLGASSSASIDVEVLNAQPYVSWGDNLPRARPGAEMTYNAETYDPGVNDNPQITWQFSDGGTATGVGDTITHTWSSTGSFSISITAQDKDGAISDPISYNVDVFDPIVDAGPAVTVSEGDFARFTFSASTPSDSYLSYTVDPGDGSDIEGPGIGDNTIWSHQYPDAGTYILTLTGTDTSGQGKPYVKTSTTIVTVENVPPAIAFIAPPYTTSGTFDFRAYVRDPGGLEGMTIAWDFGDGTTSSGELAVSHGFMEPGVYSITATATDKHGGVGSFTSQMTVSDTLASAITEQTSSGKQFLLTFDVNVEEESPYLKLFVSGDVNTTGTVVIPGLAFVTHFSVGEAGVVSVDIPLEARGVLDFTNAVYSDGTPGAIAPLAIYVTADHDITVYGINRAEHTTDAFLGLPITADGKRYRVVDYAGWTGGLMSVVSTEDNTSVYIQPTADMGIDPFTIKLSLGEVYEWEASGGVNLTGTVVESDKPISVFAGNRCTFVPTDVWACDHIIEQMMPTNTWGKTFVTYPLYGRTQDTFRIVADLDGTEVTINKESGTETQNLSAGEFWEFLSGEPMAITSNLPIEVAQYSNGSMFDDTDTDPFMVLVPPYEQGFTDSVFATPLDDFTNYVNITAPTANIGDILLDGDPVPSDQWQAIPNSDYSGVAVPIEAGNHRISSPVPLQTIVYGFAWCDSYGYPGGLRTARIADANILTMDPVEVSGITGNEICTTATLADSDGVGIPGARLDVSLTGIVEQSTSVVTGADGTTPVCATSATDGTATVTVTQGSLTDQATLIWSQNPQTFTVSYDGNGSTGSVTDATSYTSGGKATVAANGFALDGNDFDSWNTKANGSGTSYAPGATLTVTGNVTLYAQWKPVPVPTYTVIFMDGQDHVIDTVTVAEGGAATAPPNPTRDGYLFTTWDKAFDNVTSDLTVTALWTKVENAVTVTFDSDGGTPATTTANADKGKTVALPAPPTKTHFDFGGWFTQKGGAGDPFAGGPVNEDLSVYAKWTPALTYTVSYDANNDGATGSMADSTTYYAQDKATVLENAFVLTGYSFTSWNTTPDGTGSSFAPDDSVMITDNVTLYAQWSKDIVNHTVRFVDGQGTTLKTDTVPDSGAAIAPANPSRDGYAFTGWDKTFSNVTSDLTVTAQWVKVENTVTVTFDSDGGTQVDPLVLEKGGVVTLPDAPTKTHCDFGGWFTQKGGAGDLFTGGPVNEDLTVYAKWTPVPTYTVSYDANSDNATGSVADSAAYYAGDVATVAQNGFSVDRFAFTSWNTSPDGTGTSYLPGSLLRVNGNLTLYAQWKASVVFAVTFVDGQGTTLSVMQVLGGGAAVAPTDPTRDGYVFTGWDKTFNNVVSDLTVTALWKAVEKPVIESHTGGTAQSSGFLLVLSGMAIVVGLLIYRLRRTIS